MKNIIKYIILKIGYFFFSNNDSKILFYHDIHLNEKFTDNSTSFKLFKKHIKVIKDEGFEIVPNITQKYNQVKLQFDDGYKGIFDCLNYLINENIYIEIFIITSKIGHKNFLNQDQIIKLLESKYVKISSHTHLHFKLNKVENKILKKEINDSKSILEDLFKINVDSICYPFGCFSNQVVKECNSLYSYQYSSLAGSYKNNPFKNVYRRNLIQFASCKELKMILKGASSIFNIIYFKKHIK